MLDIAKIACHLSMPESDSIVNQQCPLFVRKAFDEKQSLVIGCLFALVALGDLACLQTKKMILIHVTARLAGGREEQ